METKITDPATAAAGCTSTNDHGPHYLGRDDRGVPQRCQGYTWDGALAGDWWRETGWTGR